MSDVILDKEGKPVFIGKEDPNNKPTPEVPVNTRWCSYCNKRFSYENPSCPECHQEFGDGKMECPVCKKWFDYLIGENTFDGGIMGCEGCWKPPKSPIVRKEVPNVSEEILL